MPTATTHALLRHLGGVPVGSSLFGLELAGGKVYFCDPTHGTAGGTAESPEKANSSLLTCYGYCRDGYNDIVVFIGGATAYNPAAAFDWAKSYCHLIGVSSPLPGVGQRCRIVNTTGNDLAQPFFTLSGSGCVFANLQFFDGKDAAADGGALLVSGSRNALINVFVAGMGNATASGPFSRAGSYSCSVSGSENYFESCAIGLDTVARTAANSELIISGSRNTFKDCTIFASSVTSGKFLVKIDNSAGDLRWNVFKSCQFINYSENWATGITDAFDMPAAGNTHFVIVDPNCQFTGVGLGIADTVTHVYGSGPAPNAGFGLSTNPTT